MDSQGQLLSRSESGWFNRKPKTMSGDNLAQDVDKLRKMFVGEFDENRDKYEESDMKRITENDFYVERFIHFLDQGVEKGFQQMKEVYRWRKSFNINRFCLDNYPSEFWENGIVSHYGHDKEGTLILLFQPKFYTKLSKEKKALFEKYILHMVAFLDEKAGREFGWGIIMDCSPIGVADADARVIFNILPMFRKYFPNGCKYAYIYGLHWSINYIFKMILSAIPADSARKIKLNSLEQIHEFVGKENLPDYLKGTSIQSYTERPHHVCP